MASNIGTERPNYWLYVFAYRISASGVYTIHIHNTLTCRRWRILIKKTRKQKQERGIADEKGEQWTKNLDEAAWVPHTHTATRAYFEHLIPYEYSVKCSIHRGQCVFDNTIVAPSSVSLPTRSSIISQSMATCIITSGRHIKHSIVSIVGWCVCDLAADGDTVSRPTAWMASQPVYPPRSDCSSVWIPARAHLYGFMI